MIHKNIGIGSSVVKVSNNRAAPTSIVPVAHCGLAGRWAAQAARPGRPAGRKGAPDTFDSAGYVALLHRLKAQPADETVYAPEFRRDIEEPIADAIAVSPQIRLVVTEGNYLLLEQGHWAGVREQLDEVWFVDTDDELRRERLVQRHMHFGRDLPAARDWVTSDMQTIQELITRRGLLTDSGGGG